MKKVRNFLRYLWILWATFQKFSSYAPEKHKILHWKYMPSISHFINNLCCWIYCCYTLDILFHSETKITLFYLLSFVLLRFHLLNHSLLFAAIRYHKLYHLFLLVVICCHSLSLVITCRYLLWLVVPLFVTCCHSLSLAVARCHLLSLVVSLVVTRCHSM